VSSTTSDNMKCSLISVSRLAAYTKFRTTKCWS